MAARRPPDPALVQRARRGELTRANTEPGSAERRAVDRFTYLRRRARLPGVSARQALGHPGPADVLPRIGVLLDDPARWAELELSRGDARRGGRYMTLVRQLAEGRLGPDAFRRRVAGWRPLPGGLRFLADPDAALALLQRRREADEDVFVYESGRRAA